MVVDVRTRFERRGTSPNARGRDAIDRREPECRHRATGARVHHTR